MDSLNNTIILAKRKFFRSIINYTDPGYFILANKKNPLTQQEKEFADLYEKVFLLYTSSIIFSGPGTLYLYRFVKTQHKQPQNTQKISKLGRRCMLYLPLAIACVGVGIMMEKMNRFSFRMKEIEDFYMHHQDKDISDISFGQKTTKLE